MKWFRLVALVAMAAIGAAVAQPAPSASSKFAVQADALLKTYAAADRFSGAVLVARDDVPIFKATYGEANREWNIPVTIESRFRLASVTKQFTAAAILQL